MPIPPLIALTTIQDLFDWYEKSLCYAKITDPRGYLVRFQRDDFIHLIKLTNKYGEEPRNRRLAVQEIKRRNIGFVPGRYDTQRASELSWATEIASHPDCICENWQSLGCGSENYVKDFGKKYGYHMYRVLVCKTLGTIRQVVTIFPRERIGEREFARTIWP